MSEQKYAPAAEKAATAEEEAIAPAAEAEDASILRGGARMWRDLRGALAHEEYPAHRSLPISAAQKSSAPLCNHEPEERDGIEALRQVRLWDTGSR